MLLSKKHNFIFVHIYKNAGTSITNALRPFAANKYEILASKALKKINITPFFDPQPFHQHIKAQEIIDLIGEKNFDSYYSFAIVRNPWDWQVSLYHYMLKDKNHHQHELVKSFDNFEEYVRWRCKSEVRFQKDFIYFNDNKLLVNFVGRFENLESDFKKICQNIEIDATLPRLNVSNEIPYQEFYNEETKALVATAFSIDIETFGYSF